MFHPFKSHQELRVELALGTFRQTWVLNITMFFFFCKAGSSLRLSERTFVKQRAFKFFLFFAAVYFGNTRRRNPYHCAFFSVS